MEARATLRFARISPQKTRLVADLIRGKNVEEARRILAFTQKKGARVIGKLLDSAIANAEVKQVEDPEILRISLIWVDQGPTYRRHMPRARGRVNILRRPSSHITVVVSEDLAAKEEAAAKLAAMEAKKAKKRQTKAAKADTGAETKTKAKKAGEGDE
ncbi:MAG: 50S ribosomal protein L22 [Nitrospinae bacterium]|nr:50S ribosomal protein L22 [Nitrospinota bacterium]